MSDEHEHEGGDIPCLLIVQDGCNPYLEMLRVACSSIAEATEVSHKINTRFPMCPHGRYIAIEPIETAETMDDFFNEVVDHMREQETAEHEAQHRHIMGFVSNVADGSMEAFLDGEPVDAFQLSSMDTDQLRQVFFKRTAKGDQKLREAGIHVVEFEVDEAGGLRPKQPPVQPDADTEPKPEQQWEDEGGNA